MGLLTYYDLRAAQGLMFDIQCARHLSPTVIGGAIRLWPIGHELIGLVGVVLGDLVAWNA